MLTHGWIYFGWWTIHDTHKKLLSVKNPAALQFLTQTNAPGISSKELEYFVLPIHPLNGTHTRFIVPLFN
jgi:hypothetical protein